MALSEIEKLERRYAENPQGLTFAPLAEVHRKNGEVQRALGLLVAGLEIHPDYIPASIVLGRCHLDLGDVQAAETAFLHVVALDGENVIALKSLADISERLLKFDDAERRLRTLLSLDRSNDDALEQLHRVETSRRQAEVASSAEPASVADAPPPAPFTPPFAGPALGWVSQSSQADPSPMRMEDLDPSALREDLDEPAAMRPEEPAYLEEPLREEPLREEPLRFEDSVEPIDGLVGRELDVQSEPLGDFRVETAEDIVLESAGGTEFQMPDASQELFAAGADGVRAPFEEDAPVPPNAAWEAPPDGRMEPDAAELEAASAGEPLGAEGHSALELAPPEPVAPEPGAPEPDAPEPALAPEPVAPEPVVASAPSDFRYHRRNEDRDPAQPAAAPPKRSYSVAETGGRSVVQLFQGILSARPPAQASPAAVRQAPSAGQSGAPTRPAADALSLSSVFGEEASETPPAVPGSNQGGGSVSFDDFFTSPTASPAARTPRAPDPKNDDLDQFHAWLQNLKR